MADTQRSNQNLQSHRSVNNPIPSNTKTILDVLPDPSTYRDINHLNTPNKSNNPQVRQKLQQSQQQSITSIQSPQNNTSLKTKEFMQSPKTQNYSPVIETNDIQEVDEQADHNREQLISKLKEVNEKFRARVVELENIVATTITQTEKSFKQDNKKNQFHSHRIPEFDNQDLHQKNAMLKQFQQHINQQRKQIQSLKTKLDSLASLSKQTDIENTICDLERQNKDKSKLVKVLEARNQDQQKELQIMTKDTEYEEQSQQINKEIQKWKDKYKMLSQYKKEEEMNFKRKFQLMIQVEENRARIKESINNVKYNANSDMLDEVINQPVHTMIRVQSQQALKKEKDQLKKLEQSKNAISKVLDQTSKRYNFQKEKLLKQEQELINEIDSLKYQIQSTDQINKTNHEEIKKLNEVASKIVKHQRAPSVQHDTIKDQIKRRMINSKSVINIKVMKQHQVNRYSNNQSQLKNQSVLSIQKDIQLLDQTYKTLDSLNDREPTNRLEQKQSHQNYNTTNQATAKEDEITFKYQGKTLKGEPVKNGKIRVGKTNRNLSKE